MRRIAAALALALFPWPRAQAQCAPVIVPVVDTVRAQVLPSIVVSTPERASRSLHSSVAAVTRLEASELARMPLVTLADVLQRAPGMSLVNFDGLGFDPQVMVRGFYGGGEAEYVILLVDGTPVSQLQTGVVAWDVLPPLAAIEAVEVVRGGASSLYGDAAIGGVINVLTRGPGPGGGEQGSVRLDGAGGSHGTWRAAAELRGGGPERWKRVTLSGAVDRTAGWRDHAARTAARLGASLPLVEGGDSRLGLSLRGHWREFEEPGPLLGAQYDADRRGSDSLFRADRTADRGVALVLEGARQLSRARRRVGLSGAVSGEFRAVDAIRTLVLAPGAGDTKERAAETNRFALRLQLESAGLSLPRRDGLVVGFEAARGELYSRYHLYDDRFKGLLVEQSTSTRFTGGLYAEYSLVPLEPLRLVAGARLDALHDSYAPGYDGAHRSANHSALSPRAGVNLRYLDRGTAAGNLYLSVGRSFKAPTLDQLYDERSIPVPFPPFTLRTSNPELEPQHGVSLEAGVYQSAQAAPGLLVTATLTGYQMSMRNEIDFDVESFRYVNIGRSRHRGVEAGLSVSQARVSGYAGYALQAATSRSGAQAGKRLKAIPRHTLHAGLSGEPAPRLEAGLSVTRHSGVWLDDANTVPLPDHTRVDARLGLRIAGLAWRLELRNLLNRRYASTGFLDPSGSGQAYFFPAAGRVAELGVRVGY